MKSLRLKPVVLMAGGTDGCNAYYLESEDDYAMAVYEMCSHYGVGSSLWTPDHRGGSEDLKMFLRAYETDRPGLMAANADPYRGEDWYVFQVREKAETYWDYDRKITESTITKHIDVDKLSAIRSRSEHFLAQFGEGSPSEDTAAQNGGDTPSPKKYELTNETQTKGRHRLHRIRAVRDFADIKAGTLGGWIETEENLSHDGNAWVADEASVFCKASVTGNALVSDHAMVRDHAQVSDDAHVSMKAMVCDSAKVREHASIMGMTMIRGYADIYGSAAVAGSAFVTGKTRVYGNAWIRDEARVSGDATILGYSSVGGNAEVKGSAYIEDAKVIGTALVSQNAVLDGYMTIGGKAKIDGPDQFLSVGPFGAEQQYVTFYIGEDGIECACSEAVLPVNEFLEEAARNPRLQDHLPVYQAALECAKALLGDYVPEKPILPKKGKPAKEEE